MVLCFECVLMDVICVAGAAQPQRVTGAAEGCIHHACPRALRVLAGYTSESLMTAAVFVTCTLYWRPSEWKCLYSVWVNGVLKRVTTSLLASWSVG